MDIRAEEITKIIREQLGGFAAGVDVSETGTVLTVGDGIARVHTSSAAWPESCSSCRTASWPSR